MKRIEITVDDADADRLKLEADQLGISRSDLLRERIKCTPLKTDKRLTPTDFYDLVERTRRRAGQGVDQRQVEGIVAFVFSELAG
ncbi:hypothetical protein MedDCM-OCT-S16-C5-cds36 [uncultured Mediterranean phage MEDS3 group]|nr:hypothetical protein [uncultured phage MedDCM-OCT-S04-C148]AFX83836.1 hypothetical protein MedDCM-OCT-S16-C5-cds36 [uncultured Mediterranean phage MEDS3 group]BAR22706.1 hypothetical protein [uncultured Mediterranean phage uvMED]BAR22726.1 hypothetical protein [uncultured Mediterranean phage uvMED]BAR22735.1 hypothetical protein [uncultured Mediterranean phage uvMED]